MLGIEGAVKLSCMVVIALLFAAGCGGPGDRCTYIAGGADTCVPGAECIPGSSVVTWEGGVCFRACQSDSDCPAGSTCQLRSGPDSVCWH